MPTYITSLDTYFYFLISQSLKNSNCDISKNGFIISNQEETGPSNAGL